jgi:hypothetical protein
MLMRERDADLGDDIRKRVEAFWQSIAVGKAPEPNFERDAEFITRALRRHADAGTEMDADADLAALLAEFRDATSAAKDAEERREAKKAEILMRVGSVAKVTSPHGTLSCGETKDNPGTIITPEMVGQRYGARAGHRQFRFYPRKETQQ